MTISGQSKAMHEAVQQLELADLIWLGMKGYADEHRDDEARRIRNVIAAVKELRRRGMDFDAGRLMAKLQNGDGHEHGVCLRCGGEVSEVKEGDLVVRMECTDCGVL